jgi:Ferric reductase like transmembrane component
MSAVVLAAATPRAVWYLTRGAGAVTLLGLTTTVTLGILDVRRWRSRRWPRFVLDALHRDVALITLAVLVLHVLTAVVDTFAPIRLIDAVIPFASPYRPLWLGLGALALDLLLAVAITSGLRGRLGYRAWRAVHWAAYACWPLALVHGLGTGSDVKTAWLPALSAACVLVVLTAVGWRVGAAARPRPGTKLAAVGALVAGCVALAAWALEGPLAPGWARRAGTPVALLPHTVAALPAARPVARPAARPTTLPASFTARLDGSVAERVSADGARAALDFPLVLRGPTTGSLHVQLSGRVVPGGGVTLGASRVTLGPPSAPALFRGRITALAGRQVAAVVRAPTGRRLRLSIVLAVDAGRHVAGTVVANE